MTSGIANARLDASGTIADLNARLDVQVRDIRSEYWPKMEPATFELIAQTAQNRLTASGKLQQPRIQPLEINASMPFDVPKFTRLGISRRHADHCKSSRPAQLGKFRSAICP